MALEKVIEVDKIEVVREYSIQVRQATKVLDDGKQIGGVSIIGTLYIQTVH